MLTAPHIPTGEPYDSDVIEAARDWIIDNHATDTWPLSAALNRLAARSGQLNAILYSLALACGYEDHGGRIDADPTEIIQTVLTRLNNTQ